MEYTLTSFTIGKIELVEQLAVSALLVRRRPIDWRSLAISCRSMAPDDESQHYHFLFPLYGFADNTSAQVKRIAILGLPPAKGFSAIPSLAFFEHVTTADETSHRMFPLYSYVSGADDSSTFDALLLYRHRTAPSGTIDQFFPLYRYEGTAASQTMNSICSAIATPLGFAMKTAPTTVHTDSSASTTTTAARMDLTTLCRWLSPPLSISTGARTM